MSLCNDLNLVHDDVCCLCFAFASSILHYINSNININPTNIQPVLEWNRTTRRASAALSDLCESVTDSHFESSSEVLKFNLKEILYHTL